VHKTQDFAQSKWGEEMSDEIKRVEAEAQKAEASAELTEPALEQIVGGTKTKPKDPGQEFIVVTMKEV